MKSGREHWVYLPHQAVAMLRELREARSSRNFVFPTVRGEDRPIAKSTLNQAVKALGLDVEHFVLHDFRRTAATHLLRNGSTGRGNRNGPRADRQGDHDATEQADYAAEQRSVLQRWADFVDAQIEAVPQGVTVGSRRRHSV